MNIPVGPSGAAGRGTTRSAQAAIMYTKSWRHGEMCGGSTYPNKYPNSLFALTIT
jgi:hypothetical protein